MQRKWPWRDPNTQIIAGHSGPRWGAAGLWVGKAPFNLRPDVGPPQTRATTRGAFSHPAQQNVAAQSVTVPPQAAARLLGSWQPSQDPPLEQQTLAGAPRPSPRNN